MSNRYTALPSHDELEAAFDDSDDEDVSESQPPNPPRSQAPQRAPGTYNFEVDYDYPPPGSPPRPSAVALPNDHGNSNGITSFTVNVPASAHAPRGGWFGRTAAAVLPTHHARRFGLVPRVPTGVVGGGTNMDGVFANVTAKPSRPVRVQNGDETYMVPEDARPEAPPSYAAAQADSVPPYWETTVHTSLSPNAFGEVMIENLPTGSIFSFLWNMLVSVSFQFVGFLLTYMLHTSHAARLGSRAGLGVTLIQFGFSMRPDDGSNTDSFGNWWKTGDPAADSPFGSANNQTWSSVESTDNAGNDFTVVRADMSTVNEWISFFFMTIGWFTLLTSLLGFLRVKRWERGILTPQQPEAPRTAAEMARDRAVISNLEAAFGFSVAARFGRGRDSEGELVVHESRAAGRPDGEPLLIEEDAGAAHVRQREQARENDRRLRDGLQAAGLL